MLTLLCSKQHRAYTSSLTQCLKAKRQFLAKQLHKTHTDIQTVLPSYFANHHYLPNCKNIQVTVAMSSDNPQCCSSGKSNCSSSRSSSSEYSHYLASQFVIAPLTADSQCRCHNQGGTGMHPSVPSSRRVIACPVLLPCENPHSQIFCRCPSTVAQQHSSNR